MAKAKKVEESKVFDMRRNPIASPSFIGDKFMERLTRFIEGEERSANYTMEHFHKRMSLNANYAFEWSSDAFKASGQLWVAAWFHNVVKNVNEHKDEYNLLNNTQIVQMMQKHLTREVLRAAKYPPSSTSQPSNLAEQSKTAAMATLLEKINDLLQYEME